ncbi:Chloramphenicol acetyltransferase 2 [bioreactor metagenome]|uniref:Chloramphenicol acetyltransferase 2 n=1 Tax=bioreactor metagenome TaxID=1076179 RepID=A0A645BT43_9ZZZZ|nr:chloramphenicol acetyltransferase [Candidatus Metalachnospira sp.]
MFIPIDTSTWERKEHFEYYRTKIKCGYSCTVKLDVTKFRTQVKGKSLKFYPAFIYCVSKIINDTKEFRMTVDQSGNPGYFDISNANLTIFHEDTKTFSDLWTEYYPDFWEFYKNAVQNMEKYKDVHEIKARDNQPENFFCISCVPWLSYTSYNTSVPGGEPNLFPIITFGKFAENNGKYEMPFTLNISHAAADGYHSSKFFNDLQELINTIEL